MKRLYLIRHTDAAEAEAGAKDASRKLHPYGIEKTKKLAKYFDEHAVVFDCMVSSQAVRAFETAGLLAHAQNFPVEKIMKDRRIYFCTSTAYFDILYELDDKLASVAVVGHNPYITEFANYFLKEKITSMDTSAAVCIEIDADKWTDINMADYTTLFVINP